MDDRDDTPTIALKAKLVSPQAIEKAVRVRPTGSEPEFVYFVDLEEAVKGVFDDDDVRTIVGGVAKQIANAIDERRVLDSQADPSFGVLEPRIPLRREPREMLAEAGGFLFERPRGFDETVSDTRNPSDVLTEKEQILSSFVRDILA